MGCELARDQVNVLRAIPGFDGLRSACEKAIVLDAVAA